ncbi:hypothetical protein Tco_0273284 [Tanacetum coccineum]
MQTTEDKVDTSKALDASFVDTESCRTTLKEQDTSSQIKGNVMHMLMRQQHTEQANSIMEGEADQKANKFLDKISELRIHDHNNEPSSSKLVPKVVPPADKTATS